MELINLMWNWPHGIEFNRNWNWQIGIDPISALHIWSFSQSINSICMLRVRNNFSKFLTFWTTKLYNRSNRNYETLTASIRRDGLLVCHDPIYLFLYFNYFEKGRLLPNNTDYFLNRSLICPKLATLNSFMHLLLREGCVSIS